MSIIDRSLTLRHELRRLILGWCKPEILERENAREALNKMLKSRWSEISDTIVYELIYDSKPGQIPEGENYIVFIDVGLDVDWTCEWDLEEESGTLVAQASAVGARRCKHLPREQILELKRLVGQAILSGIRGSRIISLKLTKEAAEFLKERTIERSRYWTLNSAHAFTILFSFVLFEASRVIHFSAPPIDLLFGLWIGATGGLAGAYLSVIQKAGTGEWDAASGLPVHCIEVMTKLLAGILLGCLSFILTRSAGVPASIAAMTPDNYSLLLFAVAAGMIERLIPKIVTKYTTQST